MQLMLLGLALIAIGMFLMIWPKNDPRPQENMREPYESECSAKARGGAVIMIGPVPIVIGSDPRTTIILMLIALFIMLVWVLALICH